MGGNSGIELDKAMIWVSWYAYILRKKINRRKNENASRSTQVCVDDLGTVHTVMPCLHRIKSVSHDVPVPTGRPNLLHLNGSSHWKNTLALALSVADVHCNAYAEVEWNSKFSATTSRAKPFSVTPRHTAHAGFSVSMWRVLKAEFQARLTGKATKGKIEKHQTSVWF